MLMPKTGGGCVKMLFVLIVGGAISGLSRMALVSVGAIR